MKKIIIKRKSYIFSIFIISMLNVFVLYSIFRLIFEIKSFTFGLRLYTICFVSFLFLIALIKSNRIYFNKIILFLDDNILIVKNGFLSKRISITNFHKYEFVNQENIFVEQIRIESFKNNAKDLDYSFQNFLNLNYKWRLYYYVKGKRKRLLNGLEKSDVIILEDFLKLLFSENSNKNSGHN